MCGKEKRQVGGAPTCCGKPMAPAKAKARYAPQPTLIQRVRKPARPKVRTRKVLRTAPRKFHLLHKRSASAPLLSVKGKFKLNAPFAQLVLDIAKENDWYDASKKGIRLAYENLDPVNGKGQVQGLFITDPAVVNHPSPQLHLHLEQLAVETMENHKTTDATEATGEAAAAFAICKLPQYSGFLMYWGKHLHSGAGIDQIWYNPTAPALNRPKGTYLIVEAKGVNAQLGDDSHAPPAVGKQMSTGWIYNNLAMMARNGHQIAIDLMNDVGLTEEYQLGSDPTMQVPYYYAWGGASKSYYSCKHDPLAQQAVLKKVVVEAQWKLGGGFTYKVYDQKNIHA
jgi:hypothetical protein